MARPLCTLLGSFVDLLTSTRVVLCLLFFLIGILVPATFVPAFAPLLIFVARVVLGLLGLSLAACTITRRRTLRLATLVIHIGILVILAGGYVSTFAFVATVNIYEHEATNLVYDWKAGREVPLPDELRVARINTEYYPADVQVGILRHGRKERLVQARTGESFDHQEFTVRIIALDPGARTLHINVQDRDGRQIGSLVTGGRRDLLPGFPLDFQLIAFKDPQVKRIWVELEVRRGGEVVAAGTTEVNRPLQWQGMRFFLTQIAADPAGRRYAGIQISRDLGVPFVYAGFVILSLGLLLALRGWLAIRAPGERMQER